MNIPDKVKVGGIVFSVKYDNIAADRDFFGEISFIKQTITIDSTIQPGKQEETFLHEIIEAINANYAIGLEHDKLTVLAFAMHQVLKDNALQFGDLSGEGA